MAWSPFGPPPGASSLTHRFEPPVGFTLAGAPPLPMPSVGHNWNSRRNALANRRSFINRRFPLPPTRSENVSAAHRTAPPASFTHPAVLTPPHMLAGYKEAAICASDFSSFAGKITEYLSQNRVDLAASQAETCAAYRIKAAHPGRELEGGHLVAVKYMHNVYTALQQLGQIANGARLLYQNGRFEIHKGTDVLPITPDSIGPIQRTYGGRRKATRRSKRKQRKTRRVK